MRDTIKGKCFTNPDDYDCSDVKEFARVPNIGERVFCTYKGSGTSLNVYLPTIFRWIINYYRAFPIKCKSSIGNHVPTRG